MRIFVVAGESRDLAAIETALRLGEVEFLSAAAPFPAPDQRRYAFAGWTLDVATRDLANPVGRRVNLTSSEFDLLLAFVRQPGQPLSRGALLGALRGRAWSYFDRSIDTLVARLRKKIDVEPGRPPLIRSVRGVGYVFCASVSHVDGPNQSEAA
ncbi:MAG: winged helix-turn-helix domain-containing protein [Hyphomicrobiales bacterium]|nr:winged helix-turn-helix domain-containing protein [Hyphomicrobiales bacterium]MBV8439926.1 winged helix-turn-helix domain-containing protein [Hyphomicrobiales bacterium]